eukprot:scaffold240447_cov17-Tisochrysis_lutea.AAC.1
MCPGLHLHLRPAQCPSEPDASTAPFLLAIKHGGGDPRALKHQQLQQKARAASAEKPHSDAIPAAHGLRSQRNITECNKAYRNALQRAHAGTHTMRSHTQCGPKNSTAQNVCRHLQH